MNVPGLFFQPNGIPVFIPVEAARPSGAPVPLPREYARPDGDQFARIPFDIPKRLVACFFKLVKLIRVIPCIQRSNRRLARLCGVSLATIKRWLVQMAKEGLIFILNPGSKDRTIWVLRGVKSRKRKLNSGNAAGQKILDRVGLKNEPLTGSKMDLPPSFEGARCNGQQAPTGDVPGGPGSPLGLGGEDAPLDPDAIAAALAAGMAAAAPEAARPAPVRPRPITALSIDLAASARQAKYQAAVARGDAIAMREFAPPETPSPAAESPEVDSPREGAG